MSLPYVDAVRDDWPRSLFSEHKKNKQTVASKHSVRLHPVSRDSIVHYRPLYWLRIMSLSETKSAASYASHSKLDQNKTQPGHPCKNRPVYGGMCDARLQNIMWLCVRRGFSFPFGGAALVFIRRFASFILWEKAHVFDTHHSRFVKCSFSFASTSCWQETHILSPQNVRLVRMPHIRFIFWTIFNSTGVLNVHIVLSGWPDVVGFAKSKTILNTSKPNKKARVVCFYMSIGKFYEI